MEEKRRYKRFELFLKASTDKGAGQLINVSRFGLQASVDLIVNNIKTADSIDVKIHLPNRNENVLCKGIVRHLEKKDNALIIGIEIKAMDPSAKFDILEIAYKAWGKKNDENA